MQLWRCVPIQANQIMGESTTKWSVFPSGSIRWVKEFLKVIFPQSHNIPGLAQQFPSLTNCKTQFSSRPYLTFPSCIMVCQNIVEGSHSFSELFPIVTSCWTKCPNHPCDAQRLCKRWEMKMLWVGCCGRCPPPYNSSSFAKSILHFPLPMIQLTTILEKCPRYTDTDLMLKIQSRSPTSVQM